MTIDANVDTTIVTEPIDTWPGSLVDGDTFSPLKLSIDNDSSDNVVESSDVPFELTDCA